MYPTFIIVSASGYRLIGSIIKAGGARKAIFKVKINKFRRIRSWDENGRQQQHASRCEEERTQFHNFCFLSDYNRQSRSVLSIVSGMARLFLRFFAQFL